MKKILIAIVAVLAMGTANAQGNGASVKNNDVQTFALDSAGREAQYVETIINRSKKVADALSITGTDKGQQVLHIVANRYFKLNDIYNERDKKKAEAAKLEGDAKKQAQDLAELSKESALYRSHYGFIAELSLFLNDAEIETVKDVMTYNSVSVQYNAICDMIPSLTEVEKARILAWYKEARELAIDEESSKKKHAVFGKYKGRINNYLSKRGYNLTEERKGWEQRVKARGGRL